MGASLRSQPKRVAHPSRATGAKPIGRIRRLRRSELPDGTAELARFLIGKVLVREDGGARTSGRIVETEAYPVGDAAGHAFIGMTARNQSLFLAKGHAYIYFIYGNNYCLNVSCEPDGQAGGVLFRALEPLSGVEEMAQARGLENPHPKNHGSKGLDLPNSDSINAGLSHKALINLTSGPGRLSEAFSITRPRDNGCDLTSVASNLWLGDDGYRAQGIRATPRIGITKAADKPLRYFLDGNPFVSGRKSWSK